MVVIITIAKKASRTSTHIRATGTLAQSFTGLAHARASPASQIEEPGNLFLGGDVIVVVFG